MNLLSAILEFFGGHFDDSLKIWKEDELGLKSLFDMDTYFIMELGDQGERL